MARRLPRPWLKTRPNGKKEWYVTVMEGGKQKQRFLAEEGVTDEDLELKLLRTLSASHFYTLDKDAKRLKDVLVEALKEVFSDDQFAQTILSWAKRNGLLGGNKNGSS